MRSPMSRGVLTKRLHAEGDVVKVDDLLGEIDESAAADRPVALQFPEGEYLKGLLVLRT